MLADRIEGKWIDAFERVFALCKVTKGETVALLSETQSRLLNVHIAELALQRLGATVFHIVVPTPPQDAPVPVRSTGASAALGGQDAAVKALAASGLVVDLTVEGVWDPDGDPVDVIISEVWQDEPTRTPGSGYTCPDVMGTGTERASVRAERAGPRDGRVYYLDFVADDGRGGTCEGRVTVCVPHNNGRRTVCTDQGALYSSSTCSE